MWVLTLPVLVFYIIHSAYGSQSQIRKYSELEFLGGSCFPHDTCTTLNGTNEDHLWNDRTCECGKHCIRHRTCCIDSRFIGIKDDFSSDHAQETCQKVQTTKISVYMVSSCSGKWQNSQLTEKCRNSSYGLGDPLAAVPITSLATGITYKNFFCAWCNDDSESISLWNIELKEQLRRNRLSNSSITNDILRRIEYSAETGSWGIKDVNLHGKDQSFHKLKLKFSVPEELRHMVKQCHPRIISSCSPSVNDIILRYKCWAYYSPIIIKENGSHEFTEYRNVHCALCNGVNADSNSVVCFSKTSQKKDKTPLSFAMLLDVNKKDGDVVGRMRACEDEQVYDPFFKKCRTLKCTLPNYIRKGDACVKSD